MFPDVEKTLSNEPSETTRSQSSLEMTVRPGEHNVGSKTEKHIVEITDATSELHQSQSTSSARTFQLEGSTWKTTFLRLAPLTGIACLLIAVASIFAALGILIGSRGAAVHSWTVPPSTYLAICTALVNQAVRFAAFHGLAVAWWLRAVRGDTLAQLHRSWHAGMTVSGAVISGRNMGLIGLACLCSTLVAIDGPLLQKATTIELAPFGSSPITLNVSMVQEIPTGYTGGWFEGTYAQRLSPSFNKTIPTVRGKSSNLIFPISIVGPISESSWYSGDRVPAVITGCPKHQKCRTTVKAPALAVSTCVHENNPVDYNNHLKDAEKLMTDILVTPPFGTFGLLSTVGLLLEEKEKLNLITGYGYYENCTGTFEGTKFRENMPISSILPSLEMSYDKINAHFTLVAFSRFYDVTISEGDLVQVSSDPKIIALANNTKRDHQWDEKFQFYPSTLAGIVGEAYNKLESAVYYFYRDGIVWQDGILPSIYEKYMTSYGNPETYCPSFNDPREDIIHNLNRLMFLVGAQAATDPEQSRVTGKIDPGLPINTTTLGYLEGSHEVFATNLHWFAGAVVVELVCIALILPTYFGWWKLGRSVSFSPLELAKAFDSPILSDCNSNSTGREIAKAVGKTRIKYGQVARCAFDSDATASQPRLVFDDPAVVTRPQSDVTFGR